MTKNKYSAYKRTWLHFRAVNMMVERKRSMRWTWLEKGAGEENSEGGGG